MPTNTSSKHAGHRNSADSHFSEDTVLPASLPGDLDGKATPVVETNGHGKTRASVGVGDALPRGDPGRIPARAAELARRDEGLLRTLWTRFFGRPPHHLLEEEERVPFLARILTVAQSLAVVLVLGHTEVPLLFDAALTVRILVVMALSVLIVTVVAADYCLIKTMQRVPVLARRQQWVSVGAYLAYALFVGLVEISTYAVVLYVLDRNPGALLQPAPLLPTGGLLFIAQVVLRAALIFWTMVQLFLTARKLPVQPNTLTDHSAELLGGKALDLIKALDTEHADLPMIFQAYAASVETSVNGGAGGWLAWGPLRKRAEAVAGVRRQHWARLVETLKQFSSGRQNDLERQLAAALERQSGLEEERERLAAEREARIESEVGQRAPGMDEQAVSRSNQAAVHAARVPAPCQSGLRVERTSGARRSGDAGGGGDAATVHGGARAARSRPGRAGRRRLARIRGPVPPDPT
jgi:hypothetical protein